MHDNIFQDAQISFIENSNQALNVPLLTTRFQGSKQKLLEWIWENIKDYKFNSCLDAFGGTGSVSHLFKSKGKRVHYNDLLRFNYLIGVALIENPGIKLSNDDINNILIKKKGMRYPTFIQDTFKDIYYRDDENAWLDQTVINIRQMKSKYKKALAYYALFQSCIIKRPFNLFHRKNLYLREANVQRSFGNKATWDKSFAVCFRRFAEEINSAVFSNRQNNIASNLDVFKINKNYDLVYIDTPYMNSKGMSVNYLDFYHFLEGITNYDIWAKLIDPSTKNKKFSNKRTLWDSKHTIYKAFDSLFEHFKDSILVVSYRSDGIPSIEDLFHMLNKYKNKITIVRKKYKYVLSKNGNGEEVLLIAS